MTTACCDHGSLTPGSATLSVQLNSGQCEGNLRTPPQGGNGDNEPSATFLLPWTDPSAAAQPARLFYGANVPSVPTTYGDGQTVVMGAGDLFGWTYSLDGGRTFRQRTTSTQPTPRAFGQAVFSGDPAVVAINNPTVGAGLIAYAQMGRSFSNVSSGAQASDYVVLSLSANGGDTFPVTVRVNDFVGQTSVDQPDIAVDPTDRSVWITWRAFGSVSDAYVFVRGGSVGLAADGVTPTITWFNNGVSIPTIYALESAIGPRIRVFTSGGVRQIAVAYSLHPLDLNCGTVGGRGRVDQTYAISVSQNGGANWTHRSLLGTDVIGGYLSRPLVSCVTNLPAAQQAASQWRPGFDYDPSSGNYFVAIQDASCAGGSTVGTCQAIVVLRRSAAQVMTDTSAWATVMNTRGSTLYTPSGVQWQWLPEVKADGEGRLALVYLQSDASTNTQTGAWITVASNTSGSMSWHASRRLSMFNGVAADTTVTGRVAGDYLGIAAIPSTRTPPVNWPVATSVFRGWPGHFYPVFGSGATAAAMAVQTAGYNALP